MALNVYTIAPDADFIAELVKAVLSGFPLADDDERPPLESYTILVPNRRTAQALREGFMKQSARAAMLLPRIRPIGDLDDEDFDPSAGPETDYEVLTPVAQHFVLIRLVHDWINEYRHLPLAAALRHSATQVHALARSLSQLVDSLDIEEQSPASLSETSGLELAIHQDALVSLLQLVHRHLPAVLEQRKLIGANRKRGMLIDLYARKLAADGAEGPVIAAGSTGSIPATRRLLKTIASMRHGAIVLPGLDRDLDDACWQAVTPQHPQFALKQLLQHLDIRHGDVALVGTPPGPRALLASELMRPSQTTHEWASVAGKSRPLFEAATRGIDLMECRDSEEEAAAIAALVRLCLERRPGETIAIVTPDPTLARRLTSALARFQIVPENSAGLPLNASGAGLLVRLILDLVRDPQSVKALAALLHHPSVRFAGDKRLAAMADITLLRSPLMMLGLPQIPDLLARLPEAIKLRLHPKEQGPKPGSAEWDELVAYAKQMHGSLIQLTSDERLPLGDQLGRLVTTARSISVEELWLDEPAAKLSELVYSMAAESSWLPTVTMSEAAALLDGYLARTGYRPRPATTPGVSIVGLLEARLQSFDVMILAGLSESVWPGAADSGPWLNRPMRDELQIKQPEASIGQMAHDFAQAMGARQLVLSWSREDAGQPMTPSRWLLRLKAVLKAADVEVPVASGSRWRTMALALDRPSRAARTEIPAPMPPANARLRRLSVTKADTLIKDAYSVYASDILKLRPLEEISATVSYALRGQIFHRAMSIFFEAHPERPPVDIEAALLAAGERAFGLLPNASVVRHSWWPRYQRVAQWLADQSSVFHAEGAMLFAEARISKDLGIGGRRFDLSGQADLIRIGPGGSTAIFDFKSGSVPAAKEDSAAFSYQLTLEAAIVEAEGFRAQRKLKAEQLAYVNIGGGTPAGKINEIDGKSVSNSAQHLAGLVQLLTDYMAAEQPFLARANAEADYKGRHDHLSRYKEWGARGPVP